MVDDCIIIIAGTMVVDVLTNALHNRSNYLIFASGRRSSCTLEIIFRSKRR